MNNLGWKCGLCWYLRLGRGAINHVEDHFRLRHPREQESGRFTARSINPWRRVMRWLRRSGLLT